MGRSVELSWLLDGITMRGTLTCPEVAGPFPAVVMVAGSGPTDRDWNSLLLPGDNGSGRLLAELLAAGVVSLRYDKRASGVHVAKNLPALIGHISMQSHPDELVAAVGVLAGQDEVDATRIVGLGNSEGCLHVLHYATSNQPVPFVGLVLAAPPGSRSDSIRAASADSATVSPRRSPRSRPQRHPSCRGTDRRGVSRAQIRSSS